MTCIRMVITRSPTLSVPGHYVIVVADDIIYVIKAEPAKIKTAYKGLLFLMRIIISNIKKLNLDCRAYLIYVCIFHIRIKHKHKLIKAKHKIIINQYLTSNDDYV